MTWYAPIPDHRRNALDWALLNWAAENLPEAAHAIDDRWGDWEWERRCLGAIFRRIAKQNPAWLIAVATTHPREVVALGPYVKQVEAPWGLVPGRPTWAQWVESAWI